jgi:hypothetical protein
MVLAIAAMSILLVSFASAQTAQQTFNLAVNTIYKIGVSGNPGDMTIVDAVPGSDPTPVSDNTTTYRVTHNASTNAKITASLSTPLGAGYVLTLALNGGAAVDISTGSPDVRTGIAKGASSGNAVAYTFSATAAAGPMASTPETVTLTLTNM